MHPVPRSLLCRATLAGVAAGLLLPLVVPAAASAEDVMAGDTVVGELVQAWAEHEHHDEAVAHAGDGLLTWIETATGDAVRVPTEDIDRNLPGAGVPVGATVEVVVGEEIVDHATTEDGLDPALDVLDAEVVTAGAADEPPVAAAASDEVTVVMMIPAGGTAEPGRTLAQVEAAVNGPVAAFWAGQSGSSIRITTAPGNDPAWVQATVDCSDPDALWDQAAAHANWSRTPGVGRHLLVYLPRNSPGCAYGLAQVGASIGYGGRLYVTDVATSVIAHELGHNFGLGHSSGLQCDGSVDVGTCRTEAYRDYYDVMGVSWTQLGSLAAPQAARLGLIPPQQIQSVTTQIAGGTYTLAPISGTTGIRTIRLVGSNNSVYWLEYRPADGQDSWLGATGTNPYRLQTGALLRRADQLPDTSLLFDGSPSRAFGWSGDMQVALPQGRPIGISGQDFTIAVYGSGPAGALVQVTSLRGDRSCAGRTTVPSSAVSVLDMPAVGPAAFVVGGDSGVWARTIDGQSAWGSLGGSVRYGPATATDGTSTYVFGVGTDGALYTRVTSGSGWSPWFSLGGFLTASPAAASLGPGHVRVFGRGSDGSLWSRELAFGMWWPWVPLGGYLTASPSAAVDGSGTAVLVSVRGIDGEVYTMSLPFTASVGRFERVGLVLCSAPALTRSQVAGGPAQVAYLDSRSSAWVVDSLGSVAPLGGGFTSALAVESAGGSFLVAGRGSDHALWLYDGRSGRPGWGTWVSLGGFLL